MQYGAQQLFGEAIPEFLRADPNLRVDVTSTWANGTDKFLRFFLTPEQQARVQMAGIGTYLFRKQPMYPDEIFILTAGEYQQAATTPKFKPPIAERMIPYPDGTPGFYFVRLAYADNADDVFAAEKAERSQLREAVVTIDGQPVTVRHSWIDMGEPQYMFDGDWFTLMRGMEANPFIVELIFPEPRKLGGLAAQFGAMDATLTATVYSANANQALTYSQTYREVADQQTLELSFDPGPEQVTKVRLEILSLVAGETANVHIRELMLLP
jgi:hypothetical protein